MKFKDYSKSSLADSFSVEVFCGIFGRNIFYKEIAGHRSPAYVRLFLFVFHKDIQDVYMVLNSVGVQSFTSLNVRIKAERLEKPHRRDTSGCSWPDS